MGTIVITNDIVGSGMLIFVAGPSGWVYTMNGERLTEAAAWKWSEIGPLSRGKTKMPGFLSAVRTALV